MAEEVIDYGGKKNSTWFQNKLRGLSNRYHKYKRFFLWDVHTLLHKIEPDYSKLPKDSIPILINNFNRLDLLKKQVDWLLSLEDKVSIIIVDNLSTYKPLLAYYKNIKHPLVQVVYLNFNSWRKGAEYLGEKKLKDFEKYIRKQIEPFTDVPIVFISALTKQRLFKAMETAVEVYKNRSKKIKTSELNEVLLPIIERNPPPAYKGKYVKIKYITQLPTPQPQFAFFCNLPQYVKEPYKRFLENKLREHFDFHGVPVSIYMRKK